MNILRQLRQIAKRRHLLVWIGAWSITMAMAWLAIAMLLNPHIGLQLGYIDQPPQAPRQTRQEAITLHQPTQPTTLPSRLSDGPALAFWAISIVAIACCYGAILLSQQVRPPNRR